MSSHLIIWLWHGRKKIFFKLWSIFQSNSLLLLNFYMRFLLIFGCFLFYIHKLSLIRRCFNVSSFYRFYSKLGLSSFWLRWKFFLLGAIWLSKLISFSKWRVNTTIYCPHSNSIRRLDRSVCKFKLMFSDQISSLFDNTKEIWDSSIIENNFIQIFKLILLEILYFWVISLWKNIEESFTYLILDIDR